MDLVTIRYIVSSSRKILTDHQEGAFTANDFRYKAGDWVHLNSGARGGKMGAKLKRRIIDEKDT